MKNIKIKKTELRAKPILDFLDSHGARSLSDQPAGGTYRDGWIRTYSVKGYTVIVTLHPHGWEIYLPASKQIDVETTLKAVESFLGLKGTTA